MVVGPLAEVTAEADRSLVFRALHADCGEEGGSLRDLNLLLQQLNQDIAEDLPFPTPSGRIMPLREMPAEEAITVAEGILRVQVDGRIRILSEVPFPVRDTDYT